MSDRAPYSRIYWSVRDDPRFVDVFDDDAAFALWVRLLMNADAVWPAAADLPMYARPRPLAKLVAAGIVDRVGAHAYRVHGLDAERERRRDAARTGSGRDANGRQTGPGREANGSLAEPSQAKPSTSRAEAPRDPADIYWQLTGKYPTDKPLSWIDDLTSKYGTESTIRALVTSHVADRSVATLLGRTTDLLRSEARALDRREREDEQRRLAEKRAVPRVEEPWRAEFREAIQRQYDQEGAA